MSFFLKLLDRNWLLEQKWVFFICLLSLLLRWIIPAVKKRRQVVKLLEKIPGREAWPIVGNIFDFSHHMKGRIGDGIFNHLCGDSNIFMPEGRGIYRVWKGPSPLILVSTASAIKPILSSYWQMDKSDAYIVLDQWLGAGLVSCPGKEWSVQRKFLNPAFHIQMLEDFFVPIVEGSKRFLQKLRKQATGEPFNVSPITNEFAFDAICHSMMGCPQPLDEESKITYEKYKHILEDIFNTRQSGALLLSPFFFQFSSLYKIQEKAIEEIRKITKKEIDDRKRELETVDNIPEGEGKRRRAALLDLLLTGKDAEGKPFSEQYIQQQVDTFIYAGHDTTAMALKTSFFLLGTYPEYQEKCYLEMKTIFGDSERLPTMEDLKEMNYLDCFIKESMRLYPPGSLIGRRLGKTVNINGYEVPNGTEVIINIYALHRDPKVWEDPEIFDPERFNNKNIEGYTYIPFSAGPRNCIGQKLAMLELKIALSTALRHFRIGACSKRDEMEILGALILGKPRELYVSLIPRE